MRATPLALLPLAAHAAAPEWWTHGGTIRDVWPKVALGSRLNDSRLQGLPDYLALLDIKNITFFSLDVEGFELQVHRSIDWERLEVAAMLVEVLQISEHKA